jgi:hypothetical protein
MEAESVWESHSGIIRFEETFMSVNPAYQAALADFREARARAAFQKVNGIMRASTIPSLSASSCLKVKCGQRAAFRYYSAIYPGKLL